MLAGHTAAGTQVCPDAPATPLTGGQELGHFEAVLGVNSARSERANGQSERLSGGVPLLPATANLLPLLVFAVPPLQTSTGPSCVPKSPCRGRGTPPISTVPGIVKPFPCYPHPLLRPRPRGLAASEWDGADARSGPCTGHAWRGFRGSVGTIAHPCCRRECLRRRGEWPIQMGLG